MAKRRKAILAPQENGAGMGTPYEILDRIEGSLGSCNVRETLSYQQMKEIVRRDGSSFFDNISPQEDAFRTEHDKCRFHITIKRPGASAEKLIFRFGPAGDLKEFTVHWTGDLTPWQKAQIEKLSHDLALDVVYPN